ncbi:VOC family protein [Pseudomonas sp. LRF_L74]|uniref:VOC family protein n=1 Tax=Pseudomonas sp. LRF_L74 TaxID=3369422 RepID=UPI003F615184
MLTPNFFILYVNDPLASADFYAGLFGKAPVEAAPTFALFVLDAGLKFGLWSKRDVEPAVNAIGDLGEVVFPVADRATVDTTHANWLAKGIRVAQAPVKMDFGYTFVALDPDGHRLRVFVAEHS